MRRGRIARLLRQAAALAVALIVLWLIGLWRFAAAIPSEVAAPDRLTDAIVVLTGGSQRVEGGLRLLAEGKAKKLFISGVYRGVDVTELLRVSRQTPDSVACCVVLGHTADNTAGNARETAQWMAGEGFHSLRLVTASYHMPRSLLEFSRAMPDLEIVPNPVFPEFLRQAAWWRSRAGALLIASEYSKYLVALVRPAVPSVLLPAGAGD
ncbi:MAG TPA: YdcF family protein [Stellaceae bacterium]|nr:YdcF family protein [Stellaceae bacterium]